MLHRYLPMTEEDKQQMLETIGVQSIDELFSDIPESVRFQGEYNIKPAKSEPELMKELMALAAKNADMKTYTSFLGAGCMIITSRRLLTMSFHVPNFIQRIRHISQKFPKGNCKQFSSFKR